MSRSTTRSTTTTTTCELCTGRGEPARIRTTLDGVPVVATVTRLPIERLRAGDRTVGPSGAPPLGRQVHEIVIAAADDPHGRGCLHVRNLSPAAPDLAAVPDREEAPQPRAGYFFHPAGTLMDRVECTHPVRG